MFGFTQMFPAGALVDTDLSFCSSCPNALTSVPAPSFSLLRCLGLAMFNHAVLTIETPTQQHSLRDSHVMGLRWLCGANLPH